MRLRHRFETSPKDRLIADAANFVRAPPDPTQCFFDGPLETTVGSMQANLKLGFSIAFIPEIALRASHCRHPQVSSWADDNSRRFSDKSFLYRCKSAGPMVGPLWQMTLDYTLHFTPTRTMCPQPAPLRARACVLPCWLGRPG